MYFAIIDAASLVITASKPQSESYELSDADALAIYEGRANLDDFDRVGGKLIRKTKSLHKPYFEQVQIDGGESRCSGLLSRFRNQTAWIIDYDDLTKVVDTKHVTNSLDFSDIPLNTRLIIDGNEFN